MSFIINPRYRNQAQQVVKNKEDIEKLNEKITYIFSTTENLSEDITSVSRETTDININENYSNSLLITPQGLLFKILNITDNIVTIKYYATIPTGPRGETGPQGPQGIQGVQGDRGPQGDIGLSNTLTIGSVTKGDNAEATLTGESPNQILNLVLPKGDRGPQGEEGLIFIDYPFNTTYIGVTTLVPLSAFPEGFDFYKGTTQPLLSNNGVIGKYNSPYYAGEAEVAVIMQFNLKGEQGEQGPIGLRGEQGPIGETGPQGPQGIQGQVGPIGPSNNLTIGDVIDGDEAGAFITGESPNQVLNLVLPRGETGPQGKDGINYMGSWISDNEYYKDDVVYYDHTLYILITENLIGDTTPPNQDLRNWSVFLDNPVTIELTEYPKYKELTLTLPTNIEILPSDLVETTGDGYGFGKVYNYASTITSKSQELVDFLDNIYNLLDGDDVLHRFNKLCLKTQGFASYIHYDVADVVQMTNTSSGMSSRKFCLINFKNFSLVYQRTGLGSKSLLYYTNNNTNTITISGDITFIYLSK